MIESIEFTNFKALRNTTLPLAPFTLLLGPNGSGKTSVLQALQAIAAGGMAWSPSLVSVTAEDRNAKVEIKLRVRFNRRLVVASQQWMSNSQVARQFTYEDGTVLQQSEAGILLQWLARMQIFNLDFSAISNPVAVNAGASLQSSGAGLAAVLDDLRDNQPERWASLLSELREWLPEYDYVQFDKPQLGSKAIKLRTKRGGHSIPAKDLSQGTLIALALLTLAYLPNPPSLVALEEIDRGLHPRLLRHLQDALYRLSYPESCGETRPPIQVIATSHSPYLLDLYRDHPEEVVLAEKEGLEVKMKRLSDIEYFQEILGESPLRELWYSGVLGGVSVKP
jgi:predicted ATPase